MSVNRNCPTGAWWTSIVDKVGEKIAYKLYTIYGEDIPEDLDEVVKELKTSLGGAMELSRSFVSLRQEEKFNEINKAIERARKDIPEYATHLTESDLVKGDEGYTKNGIDVTHTSVTDTVNGLKYITAKTLEERVQAQADAIWEGKGLDDTIFDADTSKPITKQEYIDIEINREKQFTVRGTLQDLAIQFALSPSVEDKERLSQEFKEVASTIQGRYSEPEYYSWLYSKVENVEALINQLNLNILDEPTNPDKIILQPTLFNDTLELAGTPDIMVSHGNHEYSIIDIKSGFQFNRETSSLILKYGRSRTRDFYQNPKDLAKLQITWYAFLQKLTDPESTFKDLKIAWITDEESLQNPTSYRMHVDLENTLPIIEAYLRTEHKDKFDKIIKDHPRIFQQSYYRAIDPRAEELLAKSENEKMLDKITQEVQYLSMTKKSKLKDILHDDIDELLTSYLKLTPDNIEKISSLNNVQDLSFGEYFTGSVHNIKNPYIKIFQEAVDRQFAKVQQEIASKLYPFKDLAKELYIHYMKNRDQNIVNALLSAPSRTIVGFGTGASKILNRLDHQDMWGWAKITEIRNGEEMERLVISEEELAESAKKFP